MYKACADVVYTHDIAAQRERLTCNKEKKKKDKNVAFFLVLHLLAFVLYFFLCTRRTSDLLHGGNASSDSNKTYNLVLSEGYANFLSNQVTFNYC